MLSIMIVRLALPADYDAMRTIMSLAIDQLQDGFLTPAQVAASHAVMGLDTQLISDRTYFLVEADGEIAGCGGWSKRATLYGGDHSSALREPHLLDPMHDPARVRAMYTAPHYARKGIGRMLLQASEEAARQKGFSAAELMATLSGEPLYIASGYRAVERIETLIAGVSVPLIRMHKLL
jgi:GNAT superfamily N-acetyltransferase